jgi:acyl-CoA synthetase (AMP-forming)/AMP-acid ligase II
MTTKGGPSRAYGRATGDAQLGLRAVRALSSAGVIAPVHPIRLARMVASPLRLGFGAATLAAVAAARHPDHLAIVDERGALTYGELHHRSERIAAALRTEFGVGPDRALAVMCRNHRGFVETLLAASRCGADLLSVNTELKGPQLAQVLAHAQPAVTVHDGEFTPAFVQAGLTSNRITAWHDGGRSTHTLDALADRPAPSAPASRRQGKVVILTSGTTGTPKMVPREPSGRSMVGAMATLLSHVPLRVREPMFIGPPVFHGFPLGFLALGLFLGSTIILRRRFEAEALLAAIEEHRIASLVVVPVMLQRMLKVRDGAPSEYRTASLRWVLSAGAPLGGELSAAFMDAFGDVLFNAYGSTEGGFGAIATPADLRVAPGTVGCPPFGTTLKILDEHRNEAPPGRTGHVFIGGEMVFEGYSGGGRKETVDGLMNTGDLGHLDGDGRLFIDGREDDMIVSGGENVFPQEVEDVLLRHDAVADAAVVGVEDVEFGQRLRAFVVRRAGAEATEEELKGHVKSNLERYKVPRDVVFVDELPRNPTGKVLRSRLTSPTESP